MAEHSRKAVAFDMDHDDMVALGRALSGESVDLTAAIPEDDQILTIRLDDLMQDDNGEVVLFNDSGMRALALATDADIVAEGSSGQHVTASGEDVSGFHYLTFDTGLTLYYQDGLEVIVRGGEPA